MALYEFRTDGQILPHLDREILLTNSLGAFASTTLVGCNTRRYHALLTAATHPPLGRVSALSRVGEILYLDGNYQMMHELSVNDFGSHFHPRGDRLLRKVTIDPPYQCSWEFQIDSVRITKTLKLSEGENAIELSYTLRSSIDRPIELQLLPFVSLRDFHGLRKCNNQPMHTEAADASVKVSDGGHTLLIEASASGTDAASPVRFNGKQDWWFNHRYRIETDRGQEDSEDLFTPGHFSIKCRGTAQVIIKARLLTPVSVAGGPILPPAVAKDTSDTLRKLINATSCFVVRRDVQNKNAPPTAGATVLAGYPWFADWGRDTMISLPGLLLTPGKSDPSRFALAKNVLDVFARHVSQGMIPNRFDDYTNEPYYNTVDASLWFIHTAHEYLAASKDQTFFNQTLLPACRNIIDGYTAGTRYGVKVDPADQLVTQGDEHTQLTWMDAKCNGVAFTPRQGKPVEINALWYHALMLLASSDPTRGKDFASNAKEVAKSFVAAFVIPQNAGNATDGIPGLYDVVEGPPPYTRKDAAIRPNQIFAASLPHSPLTPAQQAAVVNVVQKHLLTPVGLRSLAPSDHGYKHAYSGPQYQRDATYHNGIVWGWLIGPFLDAYLKIHGSSHAAVGQARQWLEPMIDHLSNDACIGSISEIFEAEAPYRPVGCCAQAWSVAEVLRLADKLKM